MANIPNWGFHYENEIMKGYIQKAFDDLEYYNDEVFFTEEQKRWFFRALGWAIDDMTAAEALAYYNTH